MTFNHQEIEALANKTHRENQKDDFLFKSDFCLFRAKLLKSKKIKIKLICSGVPSLIGVENKGTIEEPNQWHYRFKVEAKNHESIEMLLQSKEFTTQYVFKKSIVKRIPVIFSGSQGDLDFFLVKEMKKIEQFKSDK